MKNWNVIKSHVHCASDYAYVYFHMNINFNFLFDFFSEFIIRKKKKSWNKLTVFQFVICCSKVGGTTLEIKTDTQRRVYRFRGWVWVCAALYMEKLIIELIESWFCDLHLRAYTRQKDEHMKQVDWVIWNTTTVEDVIMYPSHISSWNRCDCVCERMFFKFCWKYVKLIWFRITYQMKWNKTKKNSFPMSLLKFSITNVTIVSI